jgi:hypothetical protein
MMEDTSSARSSWIGDLLRNVGASPGLGRAVLLSVACLGIYGMLAGCFEGGLQIARSAVKAPLIVALATLVCLPSFVVFQVIAGDSALPAALVRRLASFVAVTALMLVALGPVAWLFSVTSRSLGFLVLLHLGIWWLALLFGLRRLRIEAGSPGARRVVVVWLALYVLVSLQVTAYLGPVLVHEPGSRFFELQRESFVGRYHRVLTDSPDQR